MLERIAMLEGAAELLQPPTREASVVRSKLQEARFAEAERLRRAGVSPVEISTTIDAGLERGRNGLVEQLLGGHL